MKNLVILISGGGSNMAALVRAAKREDWAGRYQARMAAVISNKPDAKGLQLAQDLGLATSVVDHKAFSHAADVTDAAAVAALLQATVARAGGLDLLFVNAGVSLDQRPVE